MTVDYQIIIIKTNKKYVVDRKINIKSLPITSL